MHMPHLESARASLKKGDPVLDFALAGLLNSADKALKSGPYTLVNKKVLPESGDRHDYMSIGPYWWPDPSKPDGLPWIRRDGDVNPVSNGPTSDKPLLNKMMGAVSKLALAYYFSGDERYAKHATLLIKTWFLDPATRMNPNLQFAQAIPGKTSGRGIGIIETRGLMRLVDESVLLRKSKAFTPEVEAGLRKWIEDYSRWMVASKNGQEECAKENNHGTYCEAQVAVFALYTGDKRLAKQMVKRARTRIAKQITKEGAQPLELKRTRPFHYSLFNLEAYYFLARAGEHVGVDLWRHEASNGASLRKAIDHVASALEGLSKWEEGVEKNARVSRLYYFLQKAHDVYGGVQYTAWISQLPRYAAKESGAELIQCLLIQPNPSRIHLDTLKSVDPEGKKSRRRCYY